LINSQGFYRMDKSAQCCPSESSLLTVRCPGHSESQEKRGAISGQHRPAEPQKTNTLSIYHECL